MNISRIRHGHPKALVWAALLSFVALRLAGAPGEKKWEVTLSAPVFGAPALGAHGDVLVGTEDGRLYALTSGGFNLWSFAGSRDTLSAPTVTPEGNIYFGSHTLYALNSDGSKRWEYALPQPVATGYGGQPALGSDGAVYWAVYGLLCVVNPDGSLRWQLPGPFAEQPVIAPDGTLFVSSLDRPLLAANADGYVRWACQIFNGGPSPALTTNGAVLLVRDQAVELWSPEGVVLWSYDYSGTPLGSPIIGPEGSVYYGYGYGQVLALTADGKKRWEYVVENPGRFDAIRSTPALGADGVLYVTGHSWLHALNAQGQLLWRFDAQAEVLTSPMVGPDGTVYFGASDGRTAKLYAVEGTGAALADGQWPMFRRDPRHTASLAGFLEPPGVVNGLRATQGDLTDQVTVNWDSLLEATHYDLLRSETPEPGTALLLASNLTTRWTYEDRSAIPGTNYYYFIRARNTAGTGPTAGPVEGSRRVSQTGEVVWIFPSGGAICGMPSVSSAGDVYFGSTDGNFYAVDSTGQEKWRFSAGGSSFSTPSLGADGSVYFTAGVSNEHYAVFALTSSGATHWRVPLSVYDGASGVAIGADGALALSYATPTQSMVLVLNADGTKRWQFNDRLQFSTTPVIGADGTLYVGTAEGWVCALSPAGNLLWKLDGQSTNLTTAMIDGRGVVYFSGWGKIHAINADGQLLWKQGGALGCVGGQNLIYTGNYGAACALYPDGTIKWNSPLGFALSGGPALDAAGRVYVGGTAGAIAAVTSEGMPVWQCYMGETSLGIPVMGSGLLYAGATDGRLYAIRTDAQAAASDWPQALHDAAHTARATVAPPVPAAPTVEATARTRVTDIRVSWSSVPGATGYQIYRAYTTSPADAIMLAEVTGRIAYDDRSATPETPYTYWVNATNAAGASGLSAPATGVRRQAVAGDPLYEWVLGPPVPGSPAIGADGTVYVTAGSTLINNRIGPCKLAALGPGGIINWEVPVPLAAVLSSPTLGADGTIYFGVYNAPHSGSGVWAVNPDGTKQWELPTAGGVRSTPALGADGTLYFASSDARLFAVSPAGAILWTNSLSAGSEASPVIGPDGAIYMFTDSCLLHAFNQDGTPRWQAGIGGVPYSGISSPALAPDGTLYACTDRTLSAVNMDGSIKWRAATPVGDSPVLDPLGRIIFAGDKATLYSVDPAGTNFWSYKMGDWKDSLHEPVTVSADGSIYAIDFLGKLQAISLTGALRWETPTGTNAHSSPAIAPDGTIYVGTDDGKVRSFYGTAPVADSPWPAFQQNLQHSGRATGLPVVPAGPGKIAAGDGEFTTKVRLTWASVPGAWSYNIWRSPTTNRGEGIQLATNVAVTLVFDDYSAREGVTNFYFIQGCYAGGFTAFSEPDAGFRRVALPGEISAEFPTSVGGASTAALGINGTICFTGGDGCCYALKPDFTEWWHYQTKPTTVLSMPVVGGDGTIYLTGDDKALRALSPEGLLRWQVTNINAYASSWPVIGIDGTIYVGCIGKKLYAFNPDGGKRWELNLPSDMTTVPVLGPDGRIFFASNDRKIYGVSPEGEVVWTYNMGNILLSQPAIGPDGMMYFGCCESHQLLAVTPEKNLKWTFQVNDTLRSAPVIGPDGTIYIGSSSGYTLYAINPDGTEKWRFKADFRIYSAAAIAEDATVLFVTTAGSAYALNPTGQLLWKMANLGWSPEELLLLPDRRLVLGTTDKPPVAVRTSQGPAPWPWPTFQQNPQRTGRAPSGLQIPESEQVQRFHAGESVSTKPVLYLAGRTLVRAELFCGTNLVAVATNAPFTLTWTNAPAGTHQLLVRGIDNTGYAFVGGPLAVAEEPLQLTWVLESPKRMSLQVKTLPGREYRLESTTNFTGWETIEPAQSPAPDALHWSIDLGTSPAEPFTAYRVRLQQ